MGKCEGEEKHWECPEDFEKIIDESLKNKKEEESGSDDSGSDEEAEEVEIWEDEEEPEEEAGLENEDEIIEAPIDPLSLNIAF